MVLSQVMGGQMGRLEVFSGASQCLPDEGSRNCGGNAPSGNAQTGPWKHLTIHWAQSLQESKDSIVELADGFIYVTKPYVGEVHQARSTVRCQSEILDDDILEVLVHKAHFNIYKVRVQVHQADTTIKQWSQSLDEDIMEEMVNGYNYCTLLNKRRVHQAIDSRTCWAEHAAEFNLQFGETCRICSLQGDIPKKLEEFMTPDIRSGNITHLSSFRSRHLAFSRAQILLDDLLTWSCPLSIPSETIKVFSTLEGLLAYNDNRLSAGDQIKRAIASAVGTWPEQFQGLDQPLHFLLFLLKLALVQVYFRTSAAVPDPPSLRHSGEPRDNGRIPGRITFTDQEH